MRAEGEVARKTRQRSPIQGKIYSMKARKKRFISTTTRAPKHSSCEIPILSVLTKSPILGVRTDVVLKEVEAKWFKELTTSDLGAVYPESRRKVVDTIIKFSRKNLVEKGQIHPAGEENFGIWNVTQAGIDRAMKESGNWIPKYVKILSMIEADDEAL